MTDDGGHRGRAPAGTRPSLPAGARRPYEPGSGAAGGLCRAAVRTVPRHRVRHGPAFVLAAGGGSERDRAWASRFRRGWRRWRCAGATTTGGETRLEIIEGDVRALGERLGEGDVRSGGHQSAVPHARHEPAVAEQRAGAGAPRDRASSGRMGGDRRAGRADPGGRVAAILPTERSTELDRNVRRE